METKTLLLTMHDRFHSAMSTMLGDLTDAQVQMNAPSIDGRTIAEVSVHAYSNVLGMFAAVAGREWPLEQWPLSDWPAHLARPATTAALLTLLDALHAESRTMLEDISGSALDNTAKLPWGEQLGGEAVLDALLHGLHHVDVIGGMRAVAGFPTPPEN